MVIPALIVVPATGGRGFTVKVAQHALERIEDRAPSALARELPDHAPGRDRFPGLGPAGGEGPRAVRHQVGVGQVMQSRSRSGNCTDFHRTRPDSTNSRVSSLTDR